MRELTSPDNHHLNAVMGWLELGNTDEARAELQRISPANRDHPYILEAEWRIHAEAKNWPQALAAARKLIEVAPDSPSGWINQSFSLHEMKRTQEAWNQLCPVAEKFSSVSTIAYNLACYACQLGNLTDAREWLRKAIGIRGKEDIKQLAQADPDLRPLWEEIKGL
jgi:predicted Zn-dependent protease